MVDGRLLARRMARNSAKWLESAAVPRHNRDVLDSEVTAAKISALRWEAGRVQHSKRV